MPIIPITSYASAGFKDVAFAVAVAHAPTSYPIRTKFVVFSINRLRMYNSMSDNMLTYI